MLVFLYPDLSACFSSRTFFDPHELARDRNDFSRYNQANALASKRLKREQFDPTVRLLSYSYKVIAETQLYRLGQAWRELTKLI